MDIESISSLDIAKQLGIPVIKNDRQYWIVRTNKGMYYDEFSTMGYIALGWNKIDEAIIFEMESDGGVSPDLIKDRISTLYPDESRPGLVARHIYNFTKQMKAGDIVVIPSPKSKLISFGEILEGNIYFEEITEEDQDDESEPIINDLGLYDTECIEVCDDVVPDDIDYCNFSKRRRVAWLKTVKRTSLEPKLYRSINSQLAITDISSAAPYIDRTLDNFFIKNDEVHLLLNVKKKTALTFKNYNDFFSICGDILDEFSENTKISTTPDDMQFKINVESPGWIELISAISTIPKSMSGVLIVGLVLNIIFGGKINVLYGFYSNETKGILPILLEFIRNRNELKDKIDNTFKSIEIDKRRIGEIDLKYNEKEDC